MFNISHIADKKIQDIIRKTAEKYNTEPSNVKMLMQLNKQGDAVIVYPYVSGEYKSPKTIKELLKNTKTE